MNPLSRAVAAKLVGTDTVAEWIRRAGEGDPRAQERLVREQWARAERLLRRMLGPRDDLEDLMQNVFLETFRSLSRFEGRSELSTFVGGITVRVALRAMRTRTRTPRSVPLPDDLSMPNASAEQTLDATTQLGCARELLQELSEAKRTAFMLWALVGMSVGDIAALMEASLPATRSRIFYAQKELKAKAAQHPALRELFGGDNG